MSNNFPKKTFECLYTLKLSEYRIRDMTISQDGQFLAATDGDLQLWNLDSGELLWKTFGRGGQHIAISPDSQYLAAGGKDFTAQLWSIATGEHLRQFKHNAEWEHDYKCVAFTPDSRYLITGIENSYDVWDVETGELIQAKEDFPKSVDKVIFCPDGETLVTGDSQQIQVWRLK